VGPVARSAEVGLRMSDGDPTSECRAPQSPRKGTLLQAPQARKTNGPAPFLTRILRSLGRHPAPGGRGADGAAFHVADLCHALLSERGEVSGARLAADVVSAYRALDPSGVDAFFDLLVTQFSLDPAVVARAAEAYSANSSRANLIWLQSSVEPPRQELFRRFNMARGGISVLVEMRRQLLPTLGAHPHRADIDVDLIHLFRSWFNRGFLVLQQIDWRTSAAVLERLIHYESVHQIQGWEDLRRRLEADRRCYAFFHPALPDEPLIFIEVALTRGMTAKVQPLLDQKAPVIDPGRADCAIFYSITNCQEGLRGVSFGNFLIKQVAEDLGRAFPRLRTFATLSPVPGFRDWLTRTGESLVPALSPELATLIGTVEHGAPIDERSYSDELRTEITRLCAYYLLHAKRGSAPLDSVARFHLANGARLQRLNWMGDTSQTGLIRSLGLTANYLYRLADVEHNHEAYAQDHHIVASPQLQRLARQCQSGDRSER
jgi:malonyl-CoA decarboxylase